MEKPERDCFRNFGSLLKPLDEAGIYTFSINLSSMDGNTVLNAETREGQWEINSCAEVVFNLSPEEDIYEEEKLTEVLIFPLVNIIHLEINYDNKYIFARVCMNIKEYYQKMYSHGR
jgi:hypothetical protein